VHVELHAQGYRVGRKRIERLMRERGIQGGASGDSAHDRLEPCASDRAQRPGRQFEVTAANAVWVTDVTCVWTSEGWSSWL